MMLAKRVMTLRRCDKIAGDKLCTLVYQLVKRMLAIGARFAPNDRSGRIVNRLAVPVDVLAIAFHIALLKVSRKAVHILVVWQNSIGFGVEKVVVPYAHQR